MTLCSELSIDRTDKFPIRANSSFHVLFNSVKTYSPFSLVKLQIVRNTEVIVYAFINPGFQNNLENKIDNQYMSVINWRKNNYKAIDMLIKFYPPALNLTFQILYYNAETISDRNKAKDNPSLMKNIFSKRIQLSIDPTLEFFISTKDGRHDGVNSDDIAIVSCTSKNGVPPGQPIFKYIQNFKQSSQEYNMKENRRIGYIKVSKSDHNKYIQCVSNDISEKRYIKIFHHPTALEFIPNYSNYMPNGSSIICRAIDGHPIPAVSWQYIKGPENSSQYYTITSGNNLTILPNCPLNTRWVFNCTASNSIPTSYDVGTTVAFEFVVSLGINVAGIVTGSVVGFIIFLIILLLMMRNKTFIKRKLKLSRSLNKSKEINLNDEAPNNMNSYYTYPTVNQSSNELEEKINNKKKNKRKPKLDLLVDSQTDDCIV